MIYVIVSAVPSFDYDDYVLELTDYNCDETDHDHDIDFGDDDDLTLIPGMVVPPSMLDFTRDMIDKSDDQTVLATYLPRKLKADSDLLEIFKSIGGVRSAKLAINQKSGRNWGFGFVTIGRQVICRHITCIGAVNYYHISCQLALISKL
jgi:hypothetical protein